LRFGSTTDSMFEEFSEHSDDPFSGRLFSCNAVVSKPGRFNYIREGDFSRQNM
jgi:hypothetical protein